MKTGEIGKGIAQRRKELGLSQEELAQQLHVTRQAVSKWESGAALPSVDNIVELAGILNISVDELLQLSHAEHDPALSAQSVGRLLDEQSLRHGKRIRRLTWILVAAVIVLAAGITLSTMLNVQRTNRMEQNMQQQNQQILSTIAGIEGKLANSVQNALSDGSSLLADSGCQAWDYLHDQQALLMRFFAYPQSLHEPTGASFYALLPDGSKVSTPAEVVDGGFEGTLIIPDNQEANMSLSVYVSWTEGGETFTEKIFWEDLWLNDLRLCITNLWFDAWYEEYPQLALWANLEMYVPAGRAERYPVNVRWEVFVQDELLWSTDTPCVYEDDIYLMAVRPAEEFIYLNVDSAETVVLRATVTDASGGVFTREATWN